MVTNLSNPPHVTLLHTKYLITENCFVSVVIACYNGFIERN